MFESTKFQEVAKGTFATVILSDPSMSEFTLIDLASCDLAQTERDIRDGKVFIGITSLVDGVPRTALNEPIDASTIAALSQACVQNLVERLNALGALIEVPRIDA